MAKKILIKDEKELRKAVHRDNYLLVIILLVFAIVDYDMFSVYPKLITLEDTSLKVLIVVFQFIFIASLFFWERRKKKIITILLNGEKTDGKIIESIPVRSNSRLIHYVHEFEYKVNGQKYTVFSKSKLGSQAYRYAVIYESNTPENSIVLEHLKKNVQRLISY
ncbi:hypothetical protein [Dokdonia sp.]|uniref:hypothetical protein n=1 Tax=Dokdonia sp. TaxID=2024995 RepID=UPI003263C8DB